MQLPEEGRLAIRNIGIAHLFFPVPLVFPLSSIFLKTILPCHSLSDFFLSLHAELRIQAKQMNNDPIRIVRKSLEKKFVYVW